MLQSAPFPILPMPRGVRQASMISASVIPIILSMVLAANPKTARTLFALACEGQGRNSDAQVFLGFHKMNLTFADVNINIVIVCFYIALFRGVLSPAASRVHTPRHNRYTIAEAN